MLRILVPQAVTAMMPAVVSQLVVLLKDTALGYIIAYNDLLNAGLRVVPRQLRQHHPVRDRRRCRLHSHQPRPRLLRDLTGAPEPPCPQERGSHAHRRHRHSARRRNGPRTTARLRRAYGAGSARRRVLPAPFHIRLHTLRTAGGRPAAAQERARRGRISFAPSCGVGAPVASQFADDSD